MTMFKARLLIVAIGIALPYAARLPGGLEWLQQYTDWSIGGWVLLNGVNAIAWGCLLALSFAYVRPVALLVPCLFGFGFLALAHGMLDLGSDAQAAVALVFIPIYALVPIMVGGVIGYVVDRILRRKQVR